MFHAVKMGHIHDSVPVARASACGALAASNNNPQAEACATKIAPAI
jgi:hypothetical protein